MDKIQSLFLRSKAITLFVIIYGPYMVLVLTGVGLMAGPILIGALPSVLLYGYWIFTLLKSFSLMLQSQEMHEINLKRTSRILGIGLFILVPAYWIVLNQFFLSSPALYNALAFPLIIVGFICVTLIWQALSKALYAIMNPTDSGIVTFAKYRTIFFYFLLGPLTIWFLQPLIRRTMEPSKTT